MVNKEIIRKRLKKFDEYLEILEKLKKYSYEEFLSSYEIHGSVERFLHLLIETTIDIGNHIVADLGLGEVNWYSDIPKLLYEHGYIDEKLRDIWVKMIGFRNIIVHDYLDIDKKLVYEILQNSILDFYKFKKVFANFL